MGKVGSFIKALITYLGFYLVIITLICNPQTDILFTTVDGEFNAVGKILAHAFGEGSYYFGFMFIPIIMIVSHALFGLLDDAKGFSPKVAVIVGLISSIIITAIQVIFRVCYDNYSFIMFYHNYENYFLLSSILEYRILSDINMLAIFFLGFSVYSFFVSDASYEYIEITTYYNDSGMEVGNSTSDSKNAIWIHIVLGLLTTLIPIFFANTPLIIFVVFLCVILLISRKNREGIILKSVILAIVGLIAITSVILTDTDVIHPNVIKYEWVDNNEDTNNKKIKVFEVDYSLDTIEIVIPDNYHGLEIIECDKGVLEKYQSLKFLELNRIGNINLGALFSKESKEYEPFYAQYVPKSLEEVFLRNETTIVPFAFTDCSSLKRVKITEATKFIRANAFDGCISMEFNQYENGNYIGIEGNPYYALISLIDYNVEEFKVHEDTVIIAGGAINNLPNIKRVIIPKSVMHLISFEFLSDGCYKDKSIFYQGTKEDSMKTQVLYYGDNAIYPLPENMINGTTIYYYSETEPEIEGNYWHYDDDGKTVIVW